jgi:hypothetical protein
MAKRPADRPSGAAENQVEQTVLTVSGGRMADDEGWNVTDGTQVTFETTLGTL